MPAGCQRADPVSQRRAGRRAGRKEWQFGGGAAADNPFRTAIREINADLARLDDGQNVFYMDIGNHFLAADGTLPTDVMGDGLHPNANGYRIWGEAINGRVRELMGMPVQ
jgi:lysophospholipase L1-like esterase